MVLTILIVATEGYGEETIFSPARSPGRSQIFKGEVQEIIEEKRTLLINQEKLRLRSTATVYPEEPNDLGIQKTPRNAAITKGERSNIHRNPTSLQHNQTSLQQNSQCNDSQRGECMTGINENTASG